VQGTPPRTSAQATYAAAVPTSPMAPAALAPVGAGQAHNNLQPIVAMNFCIALIGVYPPKG
jgi:microcystin-dependent protein